MLTLLENAPGSITPTTLGFFGPHLCEGVVPRVVLEGKAIFFFLRDEGSYRLADHMERC